MTPLDGTTNEELLDGMDEDQTEGNEHVVDAFILAGTDHSQARAHVKSIISSMQKTELTTPMEVFGGGNICSEANGPRRNLNIAGLNPLDLRTAKPDGPPWDFTKKVDRHLCRSMIDEQKPTWLVGSPPCTVFSLWNVAMNYPRAADQEAVKRAIAVGRRHLRFVISLYWKQVKAGRHFLHEHPASAVSWKDEAMMRLGKFPGVHSVVADQCMYGLTSPTSDGGELPAMKPTRFMPSSPQMAARLSTRCNRLHTHQQLAGGRCKDAAFYPLGLIRAILLGMRDTADAEVRAREMSREVRQVVNNISSSTGEIPSSPEEKVWESSVPYADGRTCTIKYDACKFRPKYVDEYTREVLDPQLVKDAIVDELDDFNARVWQIAHVDEMKQTPDYIRTRSRWVAATKVIMIRRMFVFVLSHVG